MSGSSYITMIFALLFVLALMGLLWIVLKKLGLAGPGGPTFGAMGNTAQPRRLQIVETLAITPQHRAVILRMDDTDHLVIVGPNGQSVVQHGAMPNVPTN